MDKIKRIAVTGGAGQIAYSLLFRLAQGELFGDKQGIALHILETAEAIQALEGVAMELADCAFPLLKEVHIGSDPETIFRDVDVAFLVGARPRGPGMERKELLQANGHIFAEQGAALNKVASRKVVVLVVGNPCNTNCLIALRHAPDLSPFSFFAMTRLDENRARAHIAEKTGVQVQEVRHMTIWGNHSGTQVPDFVNARIKGKGVVELAGRTWCEEVLVPAVQERGAKVIKARGRSSAASAAHAALSVMRDLLFPTPEDVWFSCGVYAAHNVYGIEKDLVFSFPCRSKGDGRVEIVRNVPWDAWLKEKIAITEKELIEERELIME